MNIFVKIKQNIINKNLLTMKKQNTFLAIGILLLSTVIMFSSCKKKSTTPEVSAPTFLMSSIADPNDNTYLIFQFKCTTNDVKITKILITDPLSSFTDTYDLQGQTILQNIIYQFNYSYLKSTGKWTFMFYGNRTGDNSGFISTTYMTVSKWRPGN